jgi:hypothetical protein
MSKHTPGPWKAEDNAVFSNRMCLAICYGARIPANARLIAAAPELLAALKDIARTPEGDEESAQAIARAVIAKAEGEPE